MYSEHNVKSAAYDLAQLTGVLYHVDHNEQAQMGYVMTSATGNVLVRVPDYCLASVLEFAQRCAAQAVAVATKKYNDQSRFGG